jgi:hypothetical protein
MAPGPLDRRLRAFDQCIDRRNHDQGQQRRRNHAADHRHRDPLHDLGTGAGAPRDVSQLQLFTKLRPRKARRGGVELRVLHITFHPPALIGIKSPTVVSAHINGRTGQ